MPAKKFYRTEIVQVVLHDFPIPELTADDLNYEDSDVRGSVHSRITSAVSKELTRKELYDALQARDTNAGLFLDSHDVFVCSLGPGDTVTVNSRQTETGSIIGLIEAIDFLADDRAVIRWPDGSRVECGFKDIKADTKAPTTQIEKIFIEGGGGATVGSPTRSCGISRPPRPGVTRSTRAGRPESLKA